MSVMKSNEVSNEVYNALFSELEDNIADEAIARKKYYQLLLKFGFALLPEEIREVEEIISEEIKHTEMLSRMIFRRNNIVAEK